MSTRRFCLVILLFIIVLVALFGLMASRHPFHMPRADRVRQVPEGRFWEQTIRPKSEASKAGRAVAWLDTELTRETVSETTASARLAEYRTLTADFPDLRPGLAEFLYNEAEDCQAYTRTRYDDVRQQAKYEAALKVLGPAAVAEVRALCEIEPENALWPVLLFSWELGDALEWDPEAPEGPRGQWWFYGFEPGDPEALDRARGLARQHARWKRMRGHWQDWRILEPKSARKRGFLRAVSERSASVKALLPLLSQMRETWRRCLFLGYEALQRGDRDEARLWFEATLSIGQALVAEDSLLVEVLVAMLVLDGGHMAMSDWHASVGNFIGAGRHKWARRRVIRAARVMRRRRDRDWWMAMGVPLEVGRRFIASTYVTATAMVAALIGAVVWLGSALWLLFEKRRQRRLAAPVRSVPWRFVDTLRTAALTATPLLVFATVLVCFPPNPNDNRSGFQTMPAAAAVVVGTLLLVAGVTCRRVWQMLRAAGALDRSSRLWSVLRVLTLAGLAGLAFLWYPASMRVPEQEPKGATTPLVVLAVVLAVVVVFVGAVAMILSAIARLRGKSPNVVRTEWLVRAFAVATLTLALFAVASWPATAATGRACWTTAVQTMDAETATLLGQGWIKKYFRTDVEDQTTRPATRPTTRSGSSAP